LNALVVFGTDGNAWWSRLCRRDFSHCFIVVDDGRYWIALDGDRGRARLKVVAGSDYDLAAFYREQGLTVVETMVPDGPPFWPLILATCVGIIKRLLVIRAPWVLTPYQLYRYLNKRKS